MKTKKTRLGKLLRIEFSGRLDATRARLFEETLEPCFDEKQEKVIVDFSGLEYISSAGLRSILIVEKRRHNDAPNMQIVFCSLQTVVDEIFDISGFKTILHIVDTFEEAKQVFLG